MITLINRQFTVNARPEVAWKHLNQVENWPSWAKHIKSVKVAPAGELTGESSGTIHLKNGVKSTFRMTEFNPMQNWKWVGPFLGLTVHYDHRFDSVDQHQTKLTWLVSCEGFGAAILGRLFALIYNKSLDQAIPNLMAELNTVKES